LRERVGDIPLLVEHLLKKINREIHKGIRRVPSHVMDALMAYAWPGNVRELENVLMKAVVLAQGNILNIAELPSEIVGKTTATGATGQASVADVAAGIDFAIQIALAGRVDLLEGFFAKEPESLPDHGFLGGEIVGRRS